MVMKSYRSAMVAKSVRTYRRLPSGVAIRSPTDILYFLAGPTPLVDASHASTLRACVLAWPQALRDNIV